MNVDNYGWESSLSMVANEQSRTARQRHGVTLLRPVFMNAVEVGYSYAHCDRDKKLNVRGVTIALWHFICRGHQAIALLPYCFKNYAEKSSRYSELMMLYRLNLIEFTPGYGSEKYAEVNRIMVNRAYETGGCLVARSQMQGITDNKARLIDVVEQRLLMPTFNGDDIMFPIDGPLGRNGPSLKQTLECEQGSPDWRVCSEHQLLLSDQRHWLEKLALLVPEKVSWTRIVQVIQSGELTQDNGFDPLYGTEPPTPPSPPATVIGPLDNPFQRSAGLEVSNVSISNNLNEQVQQGQQVQQVQQQPIATLQYDQPPNTTYHQPVYHYNPHHQLYQHHHHHQHQHHLPNPHQHHQQTRHHQMSPSRRYHGRHSSTRHLLRYGPPHPSEGQWRPRSKHSATTDSVESTASTQSSGEGGEQERSQSRSRSTELEVDEDVARTLADEVQREEEERLKTELEQKAKDETLAKLSQIFGYSKSVRVMDKFPGIKTFSLLVERCIQEADEHGDGCEFADVWNQTEVPEQLPEAEAIESPEVAAQEPDADSEPEELQVIVDDLIDFSDDPITVDFVPPQDMSEDIYSTHGLADLIF